MKKGNTGKRWKFLGEGRKKRKEGGREEETSVFIYQALELVVVTMPNWEMKLFVRSKLNHEVIRLGYNRIHTSLLCIYPSYAFREYWKEEPVVYTYVRVESSRVVE